MRSEAHAAPVSQGRAAQQHYSCPLATALRARRVALTRRLAPCASIEPKGEDKGF